MKLYQLTTLCLVSVLYTSVYGKGAHAPSIHGSHHKKVAITVHTSIQPKGSAKNIIPKPVASHTFATKK